MFPSIIECENCGNTNCVCTEIIGKPQFTMKEFRDKVRANKKEKVKDQTSRTFEIKCPACGYKIRFNDG
jgi:DNA-directed RNA polymerase subunit RPC12/RpoP